jgi:maleate cis-trans isomerase
VHNQAVNATSPKTPIALFVALTREVRDAALTDPTRLRAFELLEGVAQGVGQPSFAARFDALAALASRDTAFSKVLRPHWRHLLELSAGRSATR